MPTVKSVGIPTTPNAASVRDFIGCGNNRTTAVRSTAPLVPFQQDHLIGGESISRPLLPTTRPAANTGNANSVMPAAYGARIPQANVFGAKIIQHC